MPDTSSRAPAAGLAWSVALAVLLSLSACTGAPQQPGAGAATGGATETAPSGSTETAGPTESPGSTDTGGATATSTAAPAAPAEWDETAPPLPGDSVISANVTHGWAWPGPGTAFRTARTNPVPIAPPPAAPLPTLVGIGSGQHPANTPPYDQMSFRFEGGFPGYDVEVVPTLVSDGSGEAIALPNAGSIVKVTFRGAQAHSADGTAGSVTYAPPPAIGYVALTSYAPAGDFEGVVSFGLGIGRPLDAVPETRVRVVEVEKVEQGKRLYVVALQFDRTGW